MDTPLRVLIVEDSEDDALLVVRELKRGGYQPEWVCVDKADGMLDALKTGEWDLVISDYSLPEFSGLAALEILKSTDLDIPLLMVSGIVGEETAVAVMKAGAQDFFVKGQLGRLVSAIDRELRDAAGRRKQREDTRALREVKERFNAFMNNIPTPAWIKNEELQYVYANKPLAELLNRPAETFLGCTDFDLWSREIALQLRNNDAQVLESGQAVESLERVVNAAGEETISTVIKFPLSDADGRQLVAGFAIDITERIRSKEQLENANRRLQMLSSKIIGIQERERKLISRGLHDDVGQALTAVKLKLQAVGGAAAEVRQAELDDSVRIVDTALQQVRTLSLDLRPPQLDHLGLAAALRWYVERQGANAGLSAWFDAGPLPAAVHPDIETACFRMTQEAVTNVLRHAGARNVWVELRSRGEELHLRVRDDGNGFDVAHAQQRADRGFSMGIVSIEERAALVGGRIDITSAPGSGTTIDAFLPLTERVATQQSVGAAA